MLKYNWETCEKGWVHSDFGYFQASDKRSRKMLWHEAQRRKFNENEHADLLGTTLLENNDGFILVVHSNCIWFYCFVFRSYKKHYKVPFSFLLNIPLKLNKRQILYGCDYITIYILLGELSGFAVELRCSVVLAATRASTTRYDWKCYRCRCCT